MKPGTTIIEINPGYSKFTNAGMVDYHFMMGSAIVLPRLMEKVVELQRKKDELGENLASFQNGNREGQGEIDEER